MNMFRLTCRRLTFRYGCTIGSPNAVVQMTLVICSFSMRLDGIFLGTRPGVLMGRLTLTASFRRSWGIDLAMSLAVSVSQL